MLYFVVEISVLHIYSYLMKAFLLGFLLRVVMVTLLNMISFCFSCGFNTTMYLLNAINTVSVLYSLHNIFIICVSLFYFLI